MSITRSMSASTGPKVDWARNRAAASRVAGFSTTTTGGGGAGGGGGVEPPSSLLPPPPPPQAASAQASIKALMLFMAHFRERSGLEDIVWLPAAVCPPLVGCGSCWIARPEQLVCRLANQTILGSH